jgi:uncharacterized protein (DUF2267 family)
LTVHHDEFVRRVEAVATAQLSQHDVDRTIAATLVTLGERLGGDQARRLAAQLPPTLQSALAGVSGPPRILDEREFLRRAAARMRLSPSEARDRVRAVLHVLQQAISGGERQRLRRALASGCASLLRAPAAARWPQAHQPQT